MNTVAKALIGAAVLASCGAVAALAQSLTTSEISHVSVSDPPGPLPDPTHVPFIPPENIKWEGDPKGEQHFTLFGDPRKRGMYAQLIKWNPGSGTRPHVHDQDRYVYVISGTWWVGTSNPYDARKSYPMPAGSFLKDVANEVHWDGVRAGAPAAVIELVGMGPVKTVAVDEQGRPLPPRPAAAK
jgi:quercetin dioxygenase-like cupin family protein